MPDYLYQTLIIALFTYIIYLFASVKVDTWKLQQDLSPDRIARLILHILFLENSKSVTLILTWPGVCVEVGGQYLSLYQIGTKSIM